MKIKKKMYEKPDKEISVWDKSIIDSVKRLGNNETNRLPCISVAMSKSRKKKGKMNEIGIVIIESRKRLHIHTEVGKINIKIIVIWMRRKFVEFIFIGEYNERKREKKILIS